MVSVYRVPQMQGVGCADVLLYFKCPTTMQMRCPVNAYEDFIIISAKETEMYKMALIVIWISFSITAPMLALRMKKATRTLRTTASTQS